LALKVVAMEAMLKALTVELEKKILEQIMITEN